MTRARQVVLDTLGTALGGYPTDLGRLASDDAATRLGGDAATLVADGRRSTVEGAAWANAVMGKFLGMDDSHRTCGHVAAELVPAALALGEQRQQRQGGDHCPGRWLRRHGRHSSQADVPQRERGLDHKGQAGTLASAITAGVAMERMPRRWPMPWPWPWIWPVARSSTCTRRLVRYQGPAGRIRGANGIYAANLADFGFRGPPGALDGPYGYFHAFGDGYDPSYLDGLGTRFELAETGFKPHAGCRFVHACVDATQELLKTGQPALDDIVSIEVGTYREAMTPSFRVDPAQRTRTWPCLAYR